MVVVVASVVGGAVDGRLEGGEVAGAGGIGRASALALADPIGRLGQLGRFLTVLLGGAIEQGAGQQHACKTYSAAV